MKQWKFECILNQKIEKLTDEETKILSGCWNNCGKKDGFIFGRTLFGQKYSTGKPFYWDNCGRGIVYQSYDGSHKLKRVVNISNTTYCNSCLHKIANILCIDIIKLNNFLKGNFINQS